VRSGIAPRKPIAAVLTALIVLSSIPIVLHSSLYALEALLGGDDSSEPDSSQAESHTFSLCSSPGFDVLANSETFLSNLRKRGPPLTLS
jgi:hypothetical protein